MGRAGDSPAPVGDPPTGSAESHIAKGRFSLARTVAAFPSGGSPDGTGGSPVLPRKEFSNRLLAEQPIGHAQGDRAKVPGFVAELQNQFHFGETVLEAGDHCGAGIAENLRLGRLQGPPSLVEVFLRFGMVHEVIQRRPINAAFSRETKQKREKLIDALLTGCSRPIDRLFTTSMAVCI
jgi:hypothetical protein